MSPNARKSRARKGAGSKRLIAKRPSPPRARQPSSRKITPAHKARDGERGGGRRGTGGHWVAVFDGSAQGSTRIQFTVRGRGSGGDERVARQDGAPRLNGAAASARWSAAEWSDGLPGHP